MRTKCVFLLCLALVACTAQAQGPGAYTTYLPLVVLPVMDGTMGYWSYLRPEETTNLIDNPSFELGTAGWGTGGVNVLTQVSAQQKYGVYSCSCSYQNSTTLFYYTITLPAADQYTFSVWVRPGGSWDGGAISLTIANFVGAVIDIPSTTSTVLADWRQIQITFTPNAGDLTGDLVVQCAGAATPGLAVRMDGAQCEQKGYVTTYCDGDQPGCEWNGAEHASTSMRSALSRAGGRVIDLEDLYFDVGGMFGAGMSPVLVNVDSYAILPGAALNSIKTDVREFTISGWVTGESLADLHANREALIRAFAPNSVPSLQPVILRYTGATVTKEIAAYYQAGLAGTIRGEWPCLEQNFSMRFIAIDPNFYEIGNSAAVLDTADGPTLRYATGRLRDTGQWDDLSVNAVAGGAPIVNVVRLAPNGDLWVGGSFADWDTVFPADNLAVYDFETGTWSAPGGLQGPDAVVRDIVFAPNGDAYICGEFLNVGGVGATRVARWDGAAWNALGAGYPAPAYRMTIGLDGILYVCGNHTQVRSWNGAAWANVGGAFNNSQRDIKVHPNGDIYCVGIFTTIGGVTMNRASYWDGAAWNQMANGATIGLNSDAESLAITKQGIVYVGGVFTTAGGETVNRIAIWDVAWKIVGDGTGADAGIYVMEFAPDGKLYLAGLFTTIGGIPVADRVAVFNGATFARLDINLPGAATVRGLTTGPADPVVSSNYDVFLGFDTAGVAAIAGTVNADDEGTEDAYPVITIERTGGTSAILLSIRNETLGKELLFYYGLLDGETLTIDLNPLAKSIESNFWGSRLDAVLPNSDFGTWHLQPGTNQVTSFVDVTGATVVGTVEWRDPYWSAD